MCILLMLHFGWDVVLTAFITIRSGSRKHGFLNASSEKKRFTEHCTVENIFHYKGISCAVYFLACRVYVWCFVVLVLLYLVISFIAKCACTLCNYMLRISHSLHGSVTGNADIVQINHILKTSLSKVCVCM